MVVGQEKEEELQRPTWRHRGRRVRGVEGGGRKRGGTGVAAPVQAFVAPAHVVSAVWMSGRRGGQSGIGEGGEGGIATDPK